jgi:hypothetical protein
VWRDAREELPNDSAMCLVKVVDKPNATALGRYYQSERKWHVQEFKVGWFTISSEGITYWQYLDPQA